MRDATLSGRKMRERCSTSWVCDAGPILDLDNSHRQAHHADGKLSVSCSQGPTKPLVDWKNGNLWTKTDEPTRVPPGLLVERYYDEFPGRSGDGTREEVNDAQYATA